MIDKLHAVAQKLGRGSTFWLAVAVFAFLLFGAVLAQTRFAMLYGPGLGIVGLGALAICLAAAQDLGGEKEDGDADARKPLRLRLMWKHQFQFIGIYRAAKVLAEGGKGAAPLSLEIIEGGSPIGLDPRATVFNRMDDLGVTSASALVRWYVGHQRATEEGQQLVPLLVIFKRSPACLVYRIQPALPEKELDIQYLTGKRIATSDPNDPVTIEFRTLCQEANVRNIQWDSSSLPSHVEGDPVRNLNIGGTADYRLGYSFNEGYRAVKGGLRRNRHQFTYALMADVFERDDLYADVLFTRKELLDIASTRAAIEIVVKSVKDSYAFFSNPSQTERFDDVNGLMEARCPDWWRQIVGPEVIRGVAEEMLVLLAQAWCGPRDRSLCARDGWAEIERRVYRDLGLQNPGLYLDWFTKGPAGSWLEQGSPPMAARS
jgi:hypothetical protein